MSNSDTIRDALILDFLKVQLGDLKPIRCGDATFATTVRAMQAALEAPRLTGGAGLFWYVDGAAESVDEAVVILDVANLGNLAIDRGADWTAASRAVSLIPLLGESALRDAFEIVYDVCRKIRRSADAAVEADAPRR